MGNTILAKGGNHILAKRDNSAWPKGSKLSGFSNSFRKVKYLMLRKSDAAKLRVTDFNGKAHTAYLGKSSSSYPAGGYCYQYSTSGKSAGEWYLPSAGELTLLWELQKAGIICKDKQDCFNDFARKAYWSSSEHSAESAWHLNFVSGAIVANSKASNYATRPVAQF